MLNMRFVRIVCALVWANGRMTQPWLSEQSAFEYRTYSLLLLAFTSTKIGYAWKRYEKFRGSYGDSSVWKSKSLHSGC